MLRSWNNVQSASTKSLNALKTYNASQTSALRHWSSDDAKQSDIEHEKEGTKDAAQWFKEGVTATANSAKKILQKTGLSSEKEISSSEDMGPAGSMQQRDPSASTEEQYASIKGRTKDQDGSVSKGEEQPPNMRYPDHGKNAGA